MAVGEVAFGALEVGAGGGGGAKREALTGEGAAGGGGSSGAEPMPKAPACPLPALVDRKPPPNAGEWVRRPGDVDLEGTAAHGESSSPASGPMLDDDPGRSGGGMKDALTALRACGAGRAAPPPCPPDVALLELPDRGPPPLTGEIAFAGDCLRGMTIDPARGPMCGRGAAVELNTAKGSSGSVLELAPAVDEEAAAGADENAAKGSSDEELALAAAAGATGGFDPLLPKMWLNASSSPLLLSGTPWMLVAPVAGRSSPRLPKRNMRPRRPGSPD